MPGMEPFGGVARHGIITADRARGQHHCERIQMPSSYDAIVVGAIAASPRPAGTIFAPDNLQRIMASSAPVEG
jgi:hypothetical protein